MLSGAFQADSMHLKHAHKLYDVKVVTLKSFYALNNSVATSFEFLCAEILAVFYMMLCHRVSGFRRVENTTVL